MHTRRLVLASQSPRRRALLGLLGYPFDVVVSGADEDDHLEAGPTTYVLRTAQAKAEVVALALRQERPDALIVAADTTVAQDGEIMAKPADAADARRMLLALRGRTHDVHTAVCVVDCATGQERSAVHSVAVTMRDYTSAEIDAYIATGDPLDKAGAYAIQHPSFRPVVRLEGCFLAVVGLSLCGLIPLLNDLDVHCQADLAALHAAHLGNPCALLAQATALCN